ncbi:MAG: class I tRNA ligase family protein, partial [Alphaproteobacteria bacterium]|nr:class I tRNA ligase family protein [Alphaproteobacteria bacterium]
TGENWTFVDYLKGFSYLTFEGGKFSKSEHRGIFADDAIKEFPADYWRYWLMSNAPEGSDSSFTFESFVNTINKDLNGVLGNFAQRVMKMTASKLGSVVPAKTAWQPADKALLDTLQTRVNDYIKYMNNMEFRKALNELRAIWVEGNNYISSTEPWTVIKEDEARAATILNLCLNLVRIYAILSAPIMPQTAAKMMAKFNLTPDDMPLIKDFDVAKEAEALAVGTAFETGEALFERIAPEKMTELQQKYGGSNG